MLTATDLQTIRQIFREELTSIKQANPTGFFADNQIYNLADADTLLKLGIVGIKKGSTVAQRRLRAAGIVFTSRQRSGATATGRELNKYLSTVSKSEKSFLSKN